MILMPTRILIRTSVHVGDRSGKYVEGLNRVLEGTIKITFRINKTFTPIVYRFLSESVFYINQLLQSPLQIISYSQLLIVDGRKLELVLLQYRSRSRTDD